MMNQIDVNLDEAIAAHDKILMRVFANSLLFKLYQQSNNKLKDNYTFTLKYSIDRKARKESTLDEIQLKLNIREKELEKIAPGIFKDYLMVGNSIQQHIVTEHATIMLCGVALFAISELKLIIVPRRGERGDYLLNNKGMIEISGQAKGSLKYLFEQKQKQLLVNRDIKEGYVCVANFDKLEVWLRKVK